MRKLRTAEFGVSCEIADRMDTPENVSKAKDLMLHALMRTPKIVPESVMFHGPDRNPMRRSSSLYVTCDAEVSWWFQFKSRVRYRARNAWNNFWMVMPVQPKFVTKRWPR